MAFSPLKIYFQILVAALLCIAPVTGIAANPVSSDKIIEQIEFEDIPIRDALQELATHTTLKMIATDSVANIPVSLSLRDVSAIQVIDSLAKTYRFWYQVDKQANLVRLYTRQDRKRNQYSKASISKQKLIEQIKFKDITIGEALQILAEHSDINVIASQKASRIRVTMFLRKVTALDVIEALAKTYHLWYKVDKRSKIVRLFTVQEHQLERYSANNRKNNKIIEQIEFKKISVGNALRILSEQSGLNVMASEEAANINITMFLRNVTALEVIDAISKTYNLWYQKDPRSNIVRLYTVREYRLEKVDFKKEETEVFTMKNAKNALDMAESIQNLFGRQRVRLSFGADPEVLIQDLEDRFELFDLVDQRTTLVGQQNTGNNSNQNNNNVNNRNTNSRSSRSRNRLDTRNQANVPLDEYLRSTEGVIDKFGGDTKGSGISNLLLGSQDESRSLMSAAIRHQAPIFVGVIGRQNRVLVRTRDNDAMEDIKDLYNRLNVESSMLMMEVKILSLDLSDGFNSLFDFKIKSGSVNVSTLEKTTSPANQIANAAANAAAAAASSFDPTFLATVVSKNFEARLELFEQEGRVTELATPILLTSNQEVSRVFVGEQQPIVTGFSASNNNANNVGGIGTIFSSILVPDTQLEDIGTTLLLTPNINADRTVSIRILVEQSSIADDQATIPVPLNNELVDAEIDIVQERTFSGTVTGKDATAVAVGGLIEEVSADREKKVPVLGDIPYLGFFFRETSKVRQRKELVVIMKPYILETPDASGPVSKKLLAVNSVHPDALDTEDPMMDIYKNDSRNPNGYVLQKPFKLYDRQDAFDNELGKGDVNKATTKTQDQYVELTNYASETVRLPVSEWEPKNGIKPAKLSLYRPVTILKDHHVMTYPISSWTKNGLTVTALEVRNLSKHNVEVDYKHLHGKWLAATIEESYLKGSGSGGDTTYLYLISALPFDEAVKSIK